MTHRVAETWPRHSTWPSPLVHHQHPFPCACFSQKLGAGATPGVTSILLCLLPPLSWVLSSVLVYMVSCDLVLGAIRAVLTNPPI